MTTDAQKEVGYVNSNDMMNVGFANVQLSSKPWLYVMHCLRCHKNSPVYAHLLTGRKCLHCDAGESGEVRLPCADLIRRCTGQGCRDFLNPSP